MLIMMRMTIRIMDDDNGNEDDEDDFGDKDDKKG